VKGGNCPLLFLSVSFIVICKGIDEMKLLLVILLFLFGVNAVAAFDL